MDARLAVVPPFSLNRLEDFLDATAGWVVYTLNKTAPALVNQALERYNFYHDRSVETTALRYNMPPEQAVQMARDGVLLLTATPNEIVGFFKEMTQFVQAAGFDGLVVIADELQQYFEPEIKSGKRDPLAPLFQIIEELVNLQGELAFGLLFIITSKELGVINDQRGDFTDRLRGNTLDLRAIYDREFPLRLWARFAETFDYTDLSEHIIDLNTLIGLGQIATRQDLSNGPRTVINVFRRVAQRALEATGQLSPYTPIDLIDDFLANRIAFDARKTIQEATSRALNASFVRGNSALEAAVKLTAAFPQDGVNQDIQQTYDLVEAFTELKASGFPEVVIEIGDRNNPAITLHELNTTQQNADELTLILREFARHYQPQAENQLQRAVNSFLSLLGLVFKSENWSVQKGPILRNLAQNAEVVYEGSFPDMERMFPQRFVHVRVLGDDEDEYETRLGGECKLVFYLDRHLDVPTSERANILGQLRTDTAKLCAVFSLNLMLPCFESLSRSIQDLLRRVVDAEQVTPLMVLELHDYLGDVISHKQSQVTESYCGND